MGRRYLHFIRHGQYEPSADGGRLTALGRRQMRRTAKRLEALEPAIVHSSDLGRAVESADILADRLAARRGPPTKREVIPTGLDGTTVPRATRARGRSNLDYLLAKHFRPARGERHEVYVCHGNLIRALLCRALDLRLTRWTAMDIHHGAITTLAVGRDRRTRLVSFNDFGHLPPSLRTET